MVHSEYDPYALSELTEAYEKALEELRRSGDHTLQQVLRQFEYDQAGVSEYIGTAYLFGNGGLHADAEKAILFLQKAAEEGSLRAGYYLAECLRFGIGIEEDILQARTYYYTLAAQSRDAELREAAKQRLHELETTE